jgi:hypothetical protein
LKPFNKANCIAMLNTLYPPVGVHSQQFVQPTAQLTRKILSGQRDGFFQYIGAVERNGPGVLAKLMDQTRKPGDATGWTSFRETVDNYLRMANSVIEECFDITGQSPSPSAASFSSPDLEEEGRRKVDSAISFGSTTSSKRNSDQSHMTRPSTSSSFSAGSRHHSRQVSKEKQLPEKPLPPPKDDDVTITQKTAGSTLERIAREIRKMKSRSNVKDEPRPRTASMPYGESTTKETSDHAPPTPSKDRGLKIKRSLRRMRSNTGLDGNGSRNDEQVAQDIPAFNAHEMKRRREEWEAQQKLRNQVAFVEMNL